MEKSSQTEIDAIILKAQRGEDLNRRRNRPQTLDNYFRRRNEVLAKLSERKTNGNQQLPVRD